jgi:hypothetical protein
VSQNAGVFAGCGVLPLLLALGGCDPFERACAGPCARLSSCGAELPSLGGITGVFPETYENAAEESLGCLDRCTTYATLLPEPCDARSFALLECMTGQSCEVLVGTEVEAADGSTRRDRTSLALACLTPLEALIACVQTYRERCCVEGDPCRLEGGDRCVCGDPRLESACPDFVITPTDGPR